MLKIILYLLTLAACANDKTNYPVLSGDDWVVSGKISNYGYSNGEVIAVGLDGGKRRSKIDRNNRFMIHLPGNSTYSLYFLDTNNTGALLHFEESADIGIRDSLRLPKITLSNKLSLGEIDIKEDKAFPTNNPALILDYDNDGIKDFIDFDDQNDRLPDIDQKNNLEHIEICHFSNNKKPAIKNIPLSHLYTHLNHGDNVGPCRFTSSTKKDISATKEQVQTLKE